ncbi:MAG: inositol monophosphatase family protein [Thermoplasmata archaeon]
MSGLTSPDLEIMFRITAAAHTAVIQASSSPHRADVVAMGADGSPTEELDRVAEAEILSVLDREGVDWDFLSEEIGHVRRGGVRTLVVDPIDGTTNALRGLPFASISLALGRDNLDGIDAGVVYDFYRGTTYWAIRGGGAYCDGRQIHVRPWNSKSEILFANLGRYATDRTVEMARQARRIRALGCASLEIVKVAQGTADGYIFENAPASRNLRATDIAGGYRILVEAGGGISDFEGHPIGTFPLTVQERTSVLAWGDVEFLKAHAPRGPP